MNVNIRKNKELIRLEKHKWISELVAGRTFIDVGGLWGTINETVCLAVKSGAKSATMADIQPFDTTWWKAFHNRCTEFGVSDYESIRLDICNGEEVSKSQKYDFVHCSGIIYHVSDPLQLIKNLMAISSEYLLISSMIIPERIENSEGVVESPTGTCHMIHLLPDDKRAIFRQFFIDKKRDENIVSLKSHDELFKPDGRVKTGPWWWLYSPSTLEAMCTLCGLDIVKKHTINNFSHGVLCKMPSES